MSRVDFEPLSEEVSFVEGKSELLMKTLTREASVHFFGESRAQASLKNSVKA